MSVGTVIGLVVLIVILAYGVWLAWPEGRDDDWPDDPKGGFGVRGIG